ncbi:hypothetical protein FE782_26610 [Paenibacillus antri]|uniref:Uncharacterized protein n=1 Tax=Paenibacillus antri TaxID=2582848 RepID=A0A5R9G8Y4_9BACL|nr:hypothetical protein [Paenibacillus antri]TLS49203.1 hypothetical protein FE782_26610 [Paenibacillus antri]
MSDIDIRDCPAPVNMTLIQRLKPLAGRTVTLYQPGMPQLTKTRGVLRDVTLTSFKVGATKVFYKTSFIVELHSPAKRVRPRELTATAEGMGRFRGKLIRVGRDFIEFVRVPGRNVPSLFPLNLFTLVVCEPEDEE